MLSYYHSEPRVIHTRKGHPGEQGTPSQALKGARLSSGREEPQGGAKAGTEEEARLPPPDVRHPSREPPVSGVPRGLPQSCLHLQRPCHPAPSAQHTGSAPAASICAPTLTPSSPIPQRTAQDALLSAGNIQASASLPLAEANSPFL